MSLPDRQAILILLDRGSGDDGTRAAAANLASKAARRNTPSAMIAWQHNGTQGAEPELAALGPASRLYVLGLMSANRRRVAGFSAEALAERLVASGLHAAGKISIVADAAALPATATSVISDEVPAAAAESFAALLHNALAQLGLRTELVARVGAVQILGESAGADQGRKLSRTPDDEGWVHKGGRHKLSWTWDRDVQVVRWAGTEDAV